MPLMMSIYKGILEKIVSDLILSINPKISCKYYQLINRLAIFFFFFILINIFIIILIFIIINVFI